jgi:hypothetical protein
VRDVTDLHNTNAEPATLRQQVDALPRWVLDIWRSRYVQGDRIDLQARALVNQEAATVRAHGTAPDALAVWMRLTDLVVRVGSPAPELMAATALAGLAAGLRPQGFSPPSGLQGSREDAEEHT